MMTTFAVITLIGIVDQVDGSLAHIEWTDGRVTVREIPSTPLPIREGSTMRIDVYSKMPTSQDGLCPDLLPLTPTDVLRSSTPRNDSNRSLTIEL